MNSTNKYKYVKVLQGNYGYGWDDLIEYPEGTSIKERKADLKCYRENERNALHRIIERRVLNDQRS